MIAGPKFEDPARQGCRCRQRPLQALRLPASGIIANFGSECLRLKT